MEDSDSNSARLVRARAAATVDTPVFAIPILHGSVTHVLQDIRVRISFQSSSSHAVREAMLVA